MGKLFEAHGKVTIKQKGTIWPKTELNPLSYACPHYQQV